MIIKLYRKFGSEKVDSVLSLPMVSNMGVKLLGVLNYEKGHVYCIEEEKYYVQVFMKILENILSVYSTRKIVMILDNARIHHAKLLQLFLDDNRHCLELVFLPPYSAKLNLIEGL